jgi:hypothetical protein
MAAGLLLTSVGHFNAFCDVLGNLIEPLYKSVLLNKKLSVIMLLIIFCYEVGSAKSKLASNVCDFG